MNKKMKIAGAAVGVSLLITGLLGTTALADADESASGVTCTYEYGWHGAKGMGVGIGLQVNEVVSDLLGLTTTEIHDLRLEGYSLADIAEANGVTTDTLVDTIMAEKIAALEASVAEGTITQEQADLMIANMEARTLIMVTRTTVGAPEWSGGQGNKGIGASNGQQSGAMGSRGTGICTGTGTGTASRAGGSGRW